MNLKNISTEDLINELKNRKEVDVYVSGLYRKFEARIKRKYTDTNRGYEELPDFYTLIIIDETKVVRKKQAEDGMISRRLPRNFGLPDYLSEEQREDIILAIKRDVPIIISGEQGPTGKTTLANILKDNGIIAYEKWECLEIELNNMMREKVKLNNGEIEAFTLKIAGEPFRCSCGVNVFTKYADKIDGWETYICNGCENEYEMQ